MAPALHDFFLDVVRDEINAAVKESPKRDTGWSSKVEEVRLAIRGDELAPKAFTLVVVRSSVLPPMSTTDGSSSARTFRKQAKAHGIKMRTAVVYPIDEMKARVYRDTVELTIPSLRR